MNRRDSLLFAVAVSVLYFLANWQFGGPAYLADEIGYLNNAAWLAGRFVDGASSYHVGYALLLAPLFHFLDEPAHVWNGVMAVNALLWGGTFFSMAYVLRRLFPDLARGTQMAALLVLAIYPANVVMSGYAFSQSAVALVFMLSLVGLLRSDLGRPTSIVLHSISTGFLFWIHPSGIAVVAASLLAVLAVFARARSYRVLVLHFLLVSAVVASYKLAFEPWRIAEMAAAAGSHGAGRSLHYPSAGAVLRAAADWSYWPRILAVGLGQLSYATISTFGVAVAGAWAIVTRVRQKTGPSDNALGSSALTGGLLFILLSVLAVMGVTALTAGISGPSRLDQWLYGRYVDPYLLPLFALGIVGGLGRWPAFGVALLVWMAGLVLVEVVQISGPINWVNISGLWSAVLQSEPMRWFIIGGLGIVAVSVLPRRIVVVLVAALYVVSIHRQHAWHESLLEGHSKPSEIVPFLRTSSGVDCVGFDRSSLKGLWPASREAERANLYSFYLFDHTYRKLGVDEWKANCDGPLLTYDSTLGASPDVVVIGREKATGLLIVAKKGWYENHVQRISLPGRDAYWSRGPTESRCVTAGCFETTAAELARFSQVGELAAGVLQTTGRDGYLFFGPYATVRAGTYAVEVKGNVEELHDAVLDVVSSRGASVIASSALSAKDAAGAVVGRLHFAIDRDVQDLEVRLKVGTRDRLAIHSYSLTLSRERAPSTEVIERSGPALAGLPRVVGAYRDGRLHSDGRAGFLMHGPYLPLPPGRYRLELKGRAVPGSAAWIDVVSEKGRTSHLRLSAGTGPVDSADVIAVGTFELATSRPDVEVRAFVHGGEELQISEYRLYRLP
jgi:hypothetical protein